MAVPSDLSGLRLWLKADALTGLADGDPVTTWTDSSGNAFNPAQATTAKKPLYKTSILNGLPIVRFDGIDDVLLNASVNWTTVINTTGGGIYTFIVLMNVASAATGAAATFDDACVATDLGGNTGIAHTRDAASSLTVRAYNWDGNEDFAAVTGVGYSAWRRIAQDHDNTTLRINSEGGTMQTALSGAPAASSTLLVGSNYAGAKFIAADVAELCAWNRVLTDIERGDMLTYLSDKWLAAPPATPDVPAGHFDPDLIPAGWF
jgi:hypothetical protein